MKRELGIKTEYYYYHHHNIKWIITIQDKEDVREAWLGAEGYGVMEHMFGSAVDQKYMDPPHIETMGEFLEMVEASLEEHIEFFIEDHPDVMQGGAK